MTRRLPELAAGLVGGALVATALFAWYVRAVERRIYRTATGPWDDLGDGKAPVDVRVAARQWARSQGLTNPPWGQP